MQNTKQSQEGVMAPAPGSRRAFAHGSHARRLRPASDCTALAAEPFCASDCTAPATDRGLRTAFFAFLLAFAFALFLAIAPAPAFADVNLDSGEYTIESLTVSANMQTDGSLQVTETRIIRFERERVSLCWWQDLADADAAQAFGGVSVAQMQSVDQQEVDLIPLTVVEYDPEWRRGVVPEGSICSYDEEKNRTYAFFNAEGTYVMLQNSYVIDGAVQLYKDCAELRWRFVSAGQWASPTQNATCTVNFPVPAQAQPVEGKDVYAWSHGPGGATLSFDSSVSSVTVWEEDVPADEYSEIRILVPSEWISNATPEVLAKHNMVMHKDSVMQSELEWVDTAAIRRMSQLSSFIVFAVLSLAFVLAALLLYQVFGRVHKVKGEPEAVADLVSRQQAVVLGRLWRWNRASERDFAVVVMDLVRKGAICVNAAESDEQDYAATAIVGDGCLGFPMRSYCLTETGCIAREDLDSLEEYAMHLLFDVLGGSQGRVWVDDIAQCRAIDPVAFASHLDAWQAQLDERVDEAGCFERKGLLVQKALVVLAALYLVVAAVLSSPLQSFWPAFLALAGDVVVIAIANHMGRRSAAGSADYAACQNLRASLREAVESQEVRPHDSRGLVSHDLDSLGTEAWKKLLTCAFALDARELAVTAARRALPDEAAVQDARTQADPAYVSWLEAYEETQGRLALCDQLQLALSQVMDRASWSSQRARRKANRASRLAGLKAKRKGGSLSE